MLVRVLTPLYAPGSVPDGIKIARVLPLFKSGDVRLVSNYRPISVYHFF